MAFQNVNQKSGGKATSEAVKLTGLKHGESVTGFIIGLVPSLQNPDVMNIFMRSEDGSQSFYVYTAGNVKYMIADGKLEIGLLTKITRLADKDIKGKKSSQFEVLQDPEQHVDEATLNALSEPPANATSANSAPATKTIHATLSNAASERASVKAQAAKLTQQVSAKR